MTPAPGRRGELVCASCNPSGARPAGRDAELQRPDAVWAAAQSPAGTTRSVPSPRALSADGRRLFFESTDALVPGDTNGAADVYQWEAPGEGSCKTTSPSYSPRNGGCVDLISSGQSARDSELHRRLPERRDVFFTTASSLVAADPGLIDIYDARVGGGFPPAPPAAAPSAKGKPARPRRPRPPAPTPASAAFPAAGNVRGRPAQPHASCPKGSAGCAARARPRCVKPRQRPRSATNATDRRHRHARGEGADESPRPTLGLACAAPALARPGARRPRPRPQFGLRRRPQASTSPSPRTDGGAADPGRLPPLRDDAPASTLNPTKPNLGEGTASPTSD